MQTWIPSMQRTSTEKELMLERGEHRSGEVSFIRTFSLKEGAAFRQLLLVLSGLEIKL